MDQQTESLSEYISSLQKLLKAVKNQLPPEARNFYQGTAPEILIQLKEIRRILEQILVEVKDG